MMRSRRLKGGRSQHQQSLYTTCWHSRQPRRLSRAGQQLALLQPPSSGLLFKSLNKFASRGEDYLERVVGFFRGRVDTVWSSALHRNQKYTSNRGGIRER